jgi:3-carboxy-cis,cis-muconate cycloisomerase
MSFAERLMTPRAIAKLFDSEATIWAMLQVEAALARAEATCDVIPREAAEAIDEVCRTVTIYPEKLAERTALAGTPVVPLLADIGEVLREGYPDAEPWLHLGATSQDIIDTSLVLQLVKAVALISGDVSRVQAALQDLAKDHAETPMLSRTLLQPAGATSFGLKAAQWMRAVDRAWTSVDIAAEDALVLQFGGPSGTLVSLGDSADAIAAALADELNLPRPSAPWHTQREALAALAAALGIVGMSLAKMARDISLLAQAEVGEAAEPDAPGRGVSSAMPHKRNPVGSMRTLAAANRIPGLVSALLASVVQEHERALGSWQSEMAVWPSLVGAVGEAASAMADVCEGLTVDADAMRGNLDNAQETMFTDRLDIAAEMRACRQLVWRLLGEDR